MLVACASSTNNRCTDTPGAAGLESRFSGKGESANANAHVSSVFRCRVCLIYHPVGHNQLSYSSSSGSCVRTAVER